MNIVLLSGGSGKRLWPLSNEIRSKQFLKLIKDEHNQPESMLQRVYRQIRSAGINSNIVIATGLTQVESIKNQLSDNVDLVIEPERRDTFPAIALAASYLSLEKEINKEEVVIVLPVDPYAELEYFNTLIEMERVVNSAKVNMALMGITPTYPSEKYGYIVPKKDINSINYKEVESFQEKPNLQLAEELICRGGMWNGGVFAFKLGYLMEIVSKYIAYETYMDVAQQYSKLPKISFDYEVVEREKLIAMVEYQGQWKDIGTWNTLTEVMNDTLLGKVIMADSCKNTHVINELDIPITVLGASDMVIAASPDGILVSDKHQSSFLKPFADKILQRPMFEEREWGEYKVLDMSISVDGTKTVTKRKSVKSGEKIPYQIHKNRSEVWTILNGECLVIINDNVMNAASGDTFAINLGEKHGLEAKTNVELIEVQVGKELDNDGTEIVNLEERERELYENTCHNSSV